MITDGDLYEIGTIDQSGFDALQGSFETLPTDPYADDRLRSRRYSRFTYQNGTLKLHDHKDFMQSSRINNFVGDVERNYEDIESNLFSNPAFLAMFETFQNKVGLHPDSVIEAHQLRWHCRCRVKDPAPEGNHQDGFDFIGIFMVDTFNVDGGQIMAFKSSDSPPLLKKQLENGEYILLNDRELFHNASPLVPTANEEDGHWDVIVLTANNAGAQEQAA